MTRRLLLLFGCYVLAKLAAAAVFDFAEGRDFWSSAWWAVVTAITVVYGDLSPTTGTDRGVAIVLMHLSTLLVRSLLTAEIAAKLIVNSDAFTHDEQEEERRWHLCRPPANALPLRTTRPLRARWMR